MLQGELNTSITSSCAKASSGKYESEHANASWSKMEWQIFNEPIEKCGV